jgi:sugar-specific transcriptional regulator TrmB
MQEILTQLGFTPKEAKVYLACLELGPSEVTMIARQSAINRTTCYQILEQLTAKKVIRLAQQKPKTIYQAEEPEKLAEILEDEIKDKQNQLQKLKRSLPQLKAIYSTLENKPKVKFYEGIDGLKEMYNLSLTSTEPLRAYTSAEQLEKTLGARYTKSYFDARRKRKIPIKSILPFEPYAVKLKQEEKKYLRTMRFVPKKFYDFSPEIYIYDNKISFISLKEHFGVLIESRELAEAMKKAYDLAWAKAKEYHEEIMTKS